MSTLWTPSGEHPVDRPGQSASAPPSSPGPSRPAPGAAEAGMPDLSDLSPEDRAAAEEYARQVEEARRQLLEMPAGPVVAQQSLQFYELAAMHLSQPEPRLDDARVAIDALAAVVERLGSRLAEAETPLRQALHQIQLAYVETAKQAGAPAPGGDAASG
ncbi:MAG TPA: hypothetical protein VFI47_18430 [Acidimicrobiales bacterium]|nr:hypothetical protein [Acidimicrobiales bacterium]